MIVIEGNHTLTLSNIVLDGKAYRKDIDIEPVSYTHLTLPTNREV